jgi:hypothetical protein
MQLVLPSGRSITPPVDPFGWTEQAGTTYGDPLNSGRMEISVAAAVAFHRQRPLFQGTANVVTAIATATYTPIPLQEIIDTPSGHNDAANTSRVYAPSLWDPNNWYLVTGVIPYAGTDPTKTYTTGFRLDGSNVTEGQKMPGTTGHPVTGSVCDLVSIGGGGTHYAELLARHDAGVSVNTVISGKSPTLSLRWVSAATGFVVALPSLPRTWTAADLLTADTVGAGKVSLNLHLRDVIRFLNFPPIARISSITSTQTIPTGASTWTSIQMPTMTVDNYGMWSSGANTKLTCQRAGLYFVHGLASTAEALAASGYRAARILHTIALGGTAVYGGSSTMVATNSTAGTQVPATGWIRMAAGDTVELQLQHNDAGALTIKASTGYARLLAVWKSI